MAARIRERWMVLWLYSAYSYVLNAFWLLVDLLPHFLRAPCFRMVFKRFGKGCLFDYRSFSRYPWRVSIGNNVAINRGCELYASMQTEEGSITLEDYVVLGPGVSIFAAGHDYSLITLPDISAAVVIQRYAWIGGKSTILPGVVIGEGAVIGAGSVVNKDIPPFCVAVGNPARVVKSRIIKTG